MYNLGGCGVWVLRPSISAEPAMFDPDKLIEISIQQTIEKDIEKNIIRFTSSYPNFDFTGYFPTFPDYFIDCCGTPFCPDGCEENSSDCPKKKKTPDNLRLKRQHWSEIRSCPKKQQLVYMRVHIGDLTKQEIECIRQVSYARTYIVFRLTTEITLDSPEHSMLLKNFEAVKTANRQGLSREDRFRVMVALAVIKLASHLRSTRRRAWGYSLIVGNVPGIPVDQSARAAFKFLPNSASPTTKGSKPKQTRKRESKYEVSVENYLHKLVDLVKKGDKPQAFALNLTPMDVALALQKKEKFKTVKIKGVEHEVKIESIEDRVGRSKAWKNRHNILKEIKSTPPSSVAEAFDKRTFDKSTGLPNSVSKVRNGNEEYETAVEEFLHALHNQVAFDTIKPDKYCSMVSELTTKVVATWIQKNKPTFSGRSIVTISDGVRDSTAWINREVILNTDRYRETTEE